MLKLLVVNMLSPRHPCGRTARQRCLAFQKAVISSRVLPLVSGTRRQTKMAAMMQMAPYSAYAKKGLQVYDNDELHFCWKTVTHSRH